MQNLSAAYGTAENTAGVDDVLEMVAQMVAALAEPVASEARRRAFATLEAMEVVGCAHPQSIDGATELLTALQARGVQVAIITRNCRRVAMDLTARMSLPHDLLIAREDTIHFKPHPEPLLHALQSFAVPPENAVMVGDLWADIAAGKAAQVGGTIGIQWPHDPPNRFARCEPDVTVVGLREIFPLLLP
jgi:phosphoglycolate phosphatase